MTTRKSWKWIAGFAGIVLIAGCGGTGQNSPTAANPALLFVNSVPDSTSLDFELNGSVEQPNLSYLSSSIGVISVSPADYDLGVREDAQQVDLDTEAATFSSSNSYVVAVAGEENFGTEYAKRPILFVSTVNRVAPAGNKALLYILHAFNRAAGTATPDISFQTPGQNTAVFIPDIAYGAIGAITVNSGSQEFQVTRQESQPGSQIVFIDQTLTLQPGAIYLVLATGVEGGTGAEIPQLKLIQVPALP